MKKMKIVLMSICMMLLLAACGGEGVDIVDDATATKYSQKAEEIVLLLNEGNYSELRETFDAKMKASLTEEQLKEIEPLLQQSGDFEQIDKSSVERTDSMYVVVLVGKYAKENRIFTISFNANNEVIGLFVK